MDIFTEYMVKALGHANQKIVKDYATRSGEALDWMLGTIGHPVFGGNLESTFFERKHS